MEVQPNGREDVMETMSSTMTSSAAPPLVSMEEEGKFTVEDIVKQPVSHDREISISIESKAHFY